MNSYNINLLPKKKKQLTDKLFYFLLHYFRYIIVITMNVVISVFFYRFSQDQKIIDRNEAFKQKQEILLLTLPQLEEAEAVEFKTKEIRKLLTYQDDFFKKFDYILSITPSDIRITNLSIDKDIVLIQGSAESLISIRSFNKRLRQFDGLSSSQIKSIDKNSTDEFDFYIEIILSKI